MIDIPETRTSYWIDSVQAESYPQLRGTKEVDVVIVGAGIAGLTTAYLLKKEGLSVAVIEKDYVGSGVSGYTTGKITSQHNLIYAKLAKRLGIDFAKTYAEANETALAMIETIVLRERIDCDWRRQDNYVYTADPSQIDTFKREVDIARECGLPASFEKHCGLPFHIEGAVKFSDQATFHIQKYLAALARIVDGDGSYVFEQSPVASINTRPIRAVTVKGKVLARDIVVTTNIPTFPLAARGTYAVGVYPQQSYIVAARLEGDVDGMYISPDKDHYSILPVKNATDSLLLIGGEGHIPGTRWNAEERYERLAQYARTHFPVTDIAYQWSHRDYLGYDDMPLVGHLYPWSHHIYTATGFMKWGLTNGTMAAMILADAIQGKHNSWAWAFEPHRMTVALSIPKTIREHIGL